MGNHWWASHQWNPTTIHSATPLLKRWGTREQSSRTMVAITEGRCSRSIGALGVDGYSDGGNISVPHVAAHLSLPSRGFLGDSIRLSCATPKHRAARGVFHLQNVRGAFRRFLTGEEVPRWFGLSLILIYLAGLGTVANLGIAQAQREASVGAQKTIRHALGVLADLVGAVQDDPRFADTAPQVVQRKLRSFTENMPVRTVRLVDGVKIIASSEPGEIGKDVAPMPSALRSVRDEAGRAADWSSSDTDSWIRVPVPIVPSAQPADGAAETATQETSRYLAASLRPTAALGRRTSDYAAALAVLLVVLGALFVVYRCLREQMRGLSRIALRLHSHKDRIQDGLASLRIQDGAALDSVTGAWNELVDLTQRLLDSSQRNEANAELSRVLQNSGGGALAEALNALADGFLFVREEVRLEYANTAACRVLGWRSSDVNRKTLGELPTNGLSAKILEFVRTSLGADGQFAARSEVFEITEDKSRSGSSYRAWVLPLGGPRHAGDCAVVIRDVSQQVRSERAREDFVTQVTHELRTPLTNIRAYAETLSSGMFEDPQVITECYNVITKETRRLSRLIEDILSVSQLEVGSIHLSLDTVDLRTVLSEGVRDVRGLADEKNIDVQLVLPAKLESIRADRDKLAVVVNNLLGNAIKYTQRDGVVVVGCQLTGSEVLLTVKDNGIGIDPSDHQRVFEKFQRANDPAVQAETGTGIGLYTAREIVRQHGGDIDLISEKGKGSTFMVRLPHRESRATAMSTSTES